MAVILPFSKPSLLVRVSNMASARGYKATVQMKHLLASGVDAMIRIADQNNETLLYVAIHEPPGVSLAEHLSIFQKLDRMAQQLPERTEIFYVTCDQDLPGLRKKLLPS